MRQLNDQQIQHINLLLLKIKELGREYYIGNRVDYDLLVAELLASNKDWSREMLHRCISLLRNDEKDFTYENITELYTKLFQAFNFKQQTLYYVPVNYKLDDEYRLNSIQIKKVVSQEKHKELVDGIKYLKNNTEFLLYEWGEFNIALLDNSPYYFLEFCVHGTYVNDCYDKFHSTFLLFRGITEFYYSHDMWSFKSGKHVPRNEPMILHPPFAYIPGSDFSDIHFFHNRQTKKLFDDFLIEKGTEEIQATFKTFEDTIQDGTTKSILSSCFRLFGLSMDARTWEHSFLYLWNILDEITLSQDFRGNTQRVLERCIRFYPPEWGKLYQNKIRSLAEVRNNLVHKGITEITDIEVGILKIICVNAIKVILQNIDNIQTIEQLRLFYELKDVPTESLVKRKEFIDFVIKHRTEKSNA